MHNHIRKRFLCPLRLESILGFAILIVFCLRFRPVDSWNWRFFWDEEADVDYQQNQNEEHALDFYRGTVHNPKASELVENARSKLSHQRKKGSCWHDAYRQLLSRCRPLSLIDPLDADPVMSRLAWLLTDCFLRESSRTPLPVCPTSDVLKDCVSKLEPYANSIYEIFWNNIHAICHYLESDTFIRDTESIANELKVSAKWAVKKLHEIEKQSESLIQNSAAATETMTDVISKSDAIFERFGEIMEEQSKFREEQTLMATTISSQMVSIEASADNINDTVTASLDQQKQLLDGQNRVLQALGGIETKADIIGNVVDNIDRSVASSLGQQKQLLDSQSHALQALGGIQMQTDNISNTVAQSLDQLKQLLDVQDSALQALGDLQTKADDIGNAVTAQLEQQKRLLDGQNRALQVLGTLKQNQAKAFEERRLALQNFSEDARHNQLEVMSSLEELLGSYNRLRRSSNALLLAQNALESKQNTVLMALRKLFSLYNSVLLQSHSMKTLIFYMATIFVIYMLTSTKQTFNIRAPLYFGLWISFSIECFLFRLVGNGMSEEARTTSKTLYIRTTYTVLALVYIIFTLIQYRDYELLSYKLVVELDRRMKSIESNIVGNSSIHYKGAPSR